MSFDYHVQREEDPFNARVRNHLDYNFDALNSDENPENWSAEKVKAAAQMFERNGRAAQNKTHSGLAGDSFAATHPEYKDTKPNGLLMIHQLKTMFGEGVAYTLENYEAAFESLRASNFLNLDEKIVKEQNIEAAKLRAEAERASKVTLSDDQLQTMPLNDLRTLIDTEARKQFQRRGEEGGF